MTDKSLAHNAIDMQPKKPSWSDDPFALKGMFTRNVPMNHQRNLDNYAEELVDLYGRFDNDCYYLSFSDLPDDAQLEFARLFIESTDRDLSECIYGDDLSINSEFTCALLTMLKDNTEESREKFSQTTITNIIKYYESTFDTLLDEACNTYHANRMEEQGYYQSRDMEHGDYHWVKY